MPNRLAHALSPYLLQHADNPVDWWEWCPEAFDQARERNVPILLSVGYAACHWCHVMAHESFENDRVASAINANFVAIKVDREERPDIDAVYMQATIAMNGQGGWPMTCLLSPDGDPFFTGTYLPAPQLLNLLQAAHDAWIDPDKDVAAAAARITEQLRGQGQSYDEPHVRVPLTTAELADAVRTLRASYDVERGGFGGAPKFPPSMVLEFLLRHHARTGDADALAIVDGTCEAMARGGLYDQLGGGFARYSVDADWVVPHFEKMLYDNALLLRTYAHWWRATGSPLAERITHETAQFLLRELLTEEGMFAASLDADTDGVEGLTYVWTPAGLREALGEQDGSQAAAVLSVTDDGTFEHGASTLQLRTDPADATWWAGVRNTLVQQRNTRPQPARDDKVVLGWNGLAISGLVEAALLLEHRAYLDAALTAGRRLLDLHVTGSGVWRVSRAGTLAGAPATADDLGNLAEALLLLHQATAEPEWLSAAGRLLTEAAAMGSADGGWNDTAYDDLVLRPRGRTDNAEPCGTSALATAHLMYGALTSDPGALGRARRGVDSMGAVARQDPRFAGWALAAAEALAAGPLQVAIVGDTSGELARVARRSTSPGQVTVAGSPDAPGVPLLADRPAPQGGRAAYVCHGFVCDAPVTSPEALAERLG